jgi:hypothetical protein
MQRVCVFCGSNPGNGEAYVAAAEALGTAIARAGLGLVYGGGSVGLMGRVAGAALAAGGEVYGVIPSSMEQRELAHAGVTELYVVPSMHARKAKMSELSSAFVALPGGFGTLEELFEVLTWAQLGIHQKPIGLLDVQGYWAPLVDFIERAIDRGFVRPEYRRLFTYATSPEEMLQALRDHVPLEVPRWLEPSET